MRLSWQVSSTVAGERQLAYEIQASGSAGFETVHATTGPVERPDQVAVPDPGRALASREVRFYRVRILTGQGWTEWSPLLGVEAGLLEPGDWTALAVTLPDDPGADRQAPAPLLRREFELDSEVVRARLHVTALGVHDVRINGLRVSDDLLAPGWTSYRHRLIADTYDVTALLGKGINVVAATVGDGWYRGRLGWGPNDRCRYGADVALVAQLEVELEDGSSERIVTDSTWRSSTGEIRSADLYDGTEIDLRRGCTGWQLRGFDDSEWQPAKPIPFEPTVIESRVAPPVRVVQVLPTKRIAASSGRVVLDGGQNIAGFVRLRVRGKRGDRVIVRHAEVLEPDGSLHTRSLRSAKATDVYTLAGDDETHLEPVFTFHGFRYAEVQSEAEMLDSEIVAISSSCASRGTFECSEPILDRLHQNVMWSQRGNFVSIPTDCPQRDERLGWTGDAQAFASTGSLLLDSEAFWLSWLTDVALDQHPRLGVPSVVPDAVLDGELRFGRAGWADAATIVPWSVYEAYGDVDILRRQFPSMTQWVESLRGRQAGDGRLPASEQFGDWLDPDAPPDRPWDAKVDATFLANAFFAHSADLTAKAATVLGQEDAASEYEGLAQQVAAATWERWADHAVTTQTGCAVALEFGIVPVEERRGVGAALARLVREADGQVATGFLGTPLVLPALVDAGFVDEAYLMLLRRECPSWLYQVEQGATTVWERWDAIRPDGSIHPGTMEPLSGAREREGQMLSFNHYAYGAVVDWIYRHVAGIAPDVSEPGYRHVVFAPKPVADMEWARASVESRYGRVAISWHVADALEAEIELPFGTSGTFVAPTTDASRVTVAGSELDRPLRLGPGRHTVRVTHPRIARGRIPLPAASGSG